MMINYTATNVHAMAYMSKTPTGAVNPLAPQQVHSLKPGWNEFPQHVWEQNKDHPQIQKMLKKGTIQLMAEKVTITKGGKKVTKVVGTDDAPIRLRWFDEKRAVAIAKATFDRELLARWIDEESRHRVKKALDKQLASVTSPVTEEDEDEDEFGAEDTDDFEG